MQKVDEEDEECNHSNKNIQTYNLEPISSPRLVGFRLTIFPYVLRLPLIGKLIISYLKKMNKFKRVTDFASSLPAHMLPLYYPLHEMSDNERNCHQEMIESCPLSLKELSEMKPCNESTLSGDEDIYNNNNNESKVEFFRHWSIYDFTSRYTAGEVTPTQVAERIINIVKKTKEVNPLIVIMNEEVVLRQAAESTKRYEQGLHQGVLDGVPIAVKDEIPVQGYHVARGTSFIKERVENDCPSIARLRSQGAIIIGKTNQHELGLGTTGYNKHYGSPRNPYNTNHYTGGSSSGSAAAVAAGLVPLAIGTDGGGSIRVPAALCGVYGIKPTFKRISEDIDLAPSLESLGPIAGNLNDVALAYAIMAGARSDDFRLQSQLQPEVHLYNYINPPTSLSDVKIGYFKTHIKDADMLMVNGAMKAIEFFKSHGATIVEIELPHLQEIHLAHAMTILTEIYSCIQKYYTNSKAKFTAEIQVSLELGKSFSSSDFLSAQRVRSFAMEMVENIFKNQVDIMLSPATASIAPPLKDDVLPQGESNLNQTAALMKYMIMGNFTGIPGIVFPVEYDPESGLPISILLQSSHWREDLLFRVTRIGEKMLPFGLMKKPCGYLGSGLDLEV